MKEEILNTINRISSQYPTEMKPDLVDGIKEKIAPLTNEIVSLFEKKELTFEECYAVLNFTYDVLKYKSQKVNL
ncbi:hypothetical protein [Gemella massiliensis]|uniref:hypothetical protein n=1 Tax=Gemella massiliensis TaxID=1909670 RepID=UPI000930C81F|nr:hypothetical protein [Gemella massiliensis]